MSSIPRASSERQHVSQKVEAGTALLTHVVSFRRSPREHPMLEKPVSKYGFVHLPRKAIIAEAAENGEEKEAVRVVETDKDD